MRSFFGDCDKKGGEPHGKIVNTNPMWTKDKVIADMEDSVRDIEKQEEDNLFINAKARAKKKARKLKIQRTLSQIQASNPVGKIKGRELDMLSKTVDSFVDEIKELNPTRYDDDQGVKSGESRVNPNKQGFLSKRPCIKLKNEAEVEVAKACNMKIDENGMVSRDDMTRGTWMIQRILGIRPDHHSLKKDRPDGFIPRSNQILVPALPEDMQRSDRKSHGVKN